MKRNSRVLVNLPGSVLHNAAATLVRRTETGSAILKLLEDRGAYRTNDKLTVGPGEFSELLDTVGFK